MHANLLTPKPENRVEFDFSHLLSAPDQSGCYVIANYDGMILYIGQTVNISDRMKSHLNDSQKCGKTRNDTPYWLYYLTCPEIELNSLETGWTNEYKRKHGELPHFNKIDPPT